MKKHRVFHAGNFHLTPASTLPRCTSMELASGSTSSELGVGKTWYKRLIQEQACFKSVC